MLHTRQNEPGSALTHFVGALFSVAALVLLVVSAVKNGTAVHVATFTIFGVSMVILYAVSAVYHFVCVTNVPLKRVLRILDHSAVYLLIAGTYTPVALIILPPGWGWTIFGLVWGAALLGVLTKIFERNIHEWVSVALYLAMGWFIFVAWAPLVKAITPEALVWLVAGGVCYTVGSIFFILDPFIPRSKWFGMHEVFHIFVMLGSAAHFWLLFRYVATMQ